MNLKAVLLPLLATSTISGLTSSTLETTEDTSSTITQRNEPTQLYQREEVAEDTKSGRVSKRGLEEDLSTFVLKRKHFGLDIDGEAADDVVADGKIDNSGRWPEGKKAASRSERLRNKVWDLASRKLFDSGEHATAGELVNLPGLPGGAKTGKDKIFASSQNTFNFGQLTYLTGDLLGPHVHEQVICNAKTPKDRYNSAIKMMESFNDEYLAGSERISRADAAMEKEKEAARSTNKIFQKHVGVHSASYKESNSIDDIYWMHFLTCLTSTTSMKNSACMLVNNLDHFGECAKKTYQILHDIALENASKGNLNLAYFYEGLSSHSLTDLFSAGHIRVPSKRLRTSHCSSYKGGFATNQMHDEDSYNGLLMTNRIQSKIWWVFGDSFYFEEFNKDNRDMMGKALQNSINEVYTAFTSGEQGSGHSLGGFTNYPGKGLDYVPDLEVSETVVEDFWDVNTCPLWYENSGKMYRRFPWYRLRSPKGRDMNPPQPSANKFTLFTETFPLVGEEDQLRVSGTPDLEKGGCWFKESCETSLYSNECGVFGNWEAKEMFYSPEAAGFMPPTFATCQAYTLGGNKDFDNDCYDVLELVSMGQNCADLPNYKTCGMLSPRCTWNDNYGPNGVTGGVCVQGSCVAYTTKFDDIVPGDPTPPVPTPPDGFYMSFQGACAFNSLQQSDYNKQPGRNDAAKCAKLCLDYIGAEGICTGIAVDSGPFGDCYLYFNDSCNRADGPGFARCASRGLQAFHRGEDSMVNIMAKCDCKSEWYYKDPLLKHYGCTPVQAESWGSWCYVANPEKCEIAMHSTTQPDERWRYCGKESTCEEYSCPNGYVRRDSVICYDDSCNDQDCCIIDTPSSCDTLKDAQGCAKTGCVWIDGWFSDSCEEDAVCGNSNSAEECKNKGCAWQDGYITDACKEGICNNWYNQVECQHWDCKWVDGWFYDTCESYRRLEGDDGDVDSADEVGIYNGLEDAISSLSKDPDFVKTLTAPLGDDDSSSTFSADFQAKMKTMFQGMDKLANGVVFFVALDDGRFYSLKSCAHGPRCWSKYNDAEYTFGVVEPRWSEYINIFKVVSGEIDLAENHISEFNVPDFAQSEYNVTKEIWYGEAGWSAPFTCTLMHPDEAEICKVYNVMLSSVFSLGVQIVSPKEDEEAKPSPKKSKKAKSGAVSTKKAKNHSKSKQPKTGKAISTPKTKSLRNL